MKLNGEDIKRLVIYFFYDKDGIVDRYVPYMLDDVKSNCSDLFIVCNGKLSLEGREILTTYTKNVLVRDNTGFDVWAYKEALEYYGWERLSEYDEVVLMNFTIMGPLYPFSEMFNEMNSRDIDFWGITKHHKIDFDPFGCISYGYVPEHIQSHFIAIRKNMLNSCEFKQYWSNMPEIKDYSEAIGKHEAIFTKRFEDAGFISDVYVDTADMAKLTKYPLIIEPLELIKNRKCPIFKRRSFFDDYTNTLSATMGESVHKMYEYIDEHTDYDVNMIWENILRCNNMADIKDAMHLDYVLPIDHAYDRNVVKEYRLALFMHIYYEDQIDYCLNYALSMPVNADIYLSVCNVNTKKLLLKKIGILSPRKVKIVDVENRGRDVSALLVGAAPYVNDYDLVCFMHDKKTTQIDPQSIGETFSYRCFENNLASPEYVCNIVSTFKNNEHLGMLMPPPPNHGTFFFLTGQEWTCNCENVKKMAEELDIDVNISPDKEPISPLGTMFWFRPQALSKLFAKNWKYEDFPKEPNPIDGTMLHAIERIYGFAVQSAGYACGWCLTDLCASMELTNLRFMLREILLSYTSVTGRGLDFYGMITARRRGYLASMYNSGNNNIEVPSARKIVKEAIKKHVPKPIWKCCKKIYHIFGGKKWIG